jgi:hypothetical protein
MWSRNPLPADTMEECQHQVPNRHCLECMSPIPSSRSAAGAVAAAVVFADGRRQDYMVLGPYLSWAVVGSSAVCSNTWDARWEGC